MKESGFDIFGNYQQNFDFFPLWEKFDPLPLHMKPCGGQYTVLHHGCSLQPFPSRGEKDIWSHSSWSLLNPLPKQPRRVRTYWNHIFCSSGVCTYLGTILAFYRDVVLTLRRYSGTAHPKGTTQLFGRGFTKSSIFFCTRGTSYRFFLGSGEGFIWRKGFLIFSEIINKMFAVFRLGKIWPFLWSLGSIPRGMGFQSATKKGTSFFSNRRSIVPLSFGGPLGEKEAYSARISLKGVQNRFGLN